MCVAYHVSSKNLEIESLCFGEPIPNVAMSLHPIVASTYLASCIALMIDLCMWQSTTLSTVLNNDDNSSVLFSVAVATMSSMRVVTQPLHGHGETDQA